MTKPESETKGLVPTSPLPAQPAPRRAAAEATALAPVGHTSGTWFVSPSNPRKVLSDAINGFDPLTGENVIGGVTARPDAIANARLFAAAPDLLSALTAILAFKDRPADRYRDEAQLIAVAEAMWAQARAAISKADTQGDAR